MGVVWFSGNVAEGGGSVLCLHVEDEDIDAAELLRVTVGESVTGKGKKRRVLFVCKGILYKKEDGPMREYARAQKKVNTDPRGDKVMANFRKQKREQEDENLVDSEEEDDEGGKHLRFSPSPLLHSYAAPVSLAANSALAHSHCPLPRIACLELFR